MAMPRTIRDRCYRTEEVDLQPGGATIAVEVPSDNPFELSGNVTVVTQASGGMTAPDPRQRSKKLLNKQHNPSHINRGFMPGMGNGDEIEHGPQGAVRRAGGRSGRIIRANKFEITSDAHADFMPGMGDFGADPTGPVMADGSFNSAAPAAGPGFLSTLFGGAKDLAPTLLQARQQNISAAQAQTEQIKAQADLQRANAERAKAGLPPMQELPRGMSTGTKAGIAIGVVAVAGLLAYLAFKK